MKPIIYKICLLLLAMLSSIIIWKYIDYFKNQYLTSDGIVTANKEPLGGDFIVFYTTGQLFRNDSKQIYDYQKQERAQRELIDCRETVFQGFMPFVIRHLLPDCSLCLVGR